MGEAVLPAVSCVCVSGVSGDSTCRDLPAVTCSTGGEEAGACDVSGAPSFCPAVPSLPAPEPSGGHVLQGNVLLSLCHPSNFQLPNYYCFLLSLSLSP